MKETHYSLTKKILVMVINRLDYVIRAPYVLPLNMKGTIQSCHPQRAISL